MGSPLTTDDISRGLVVQRYKDELNSAFADFLELGLKQMSMQLAKKQTAELKAREQELLQQEAKARAVLQYSRTMQPLFHSSKDVAEVKQKHEVSTSDSKMDPCRKICAQSVP